MVKLGGSGYDAGILDQLKFMEVFVGSAREERVAVISAGGDEAINKD